MNLILLSGAHTHTHGYLREIEQDDSLTLRMVWDDMPSRGKAIAEKMGCRYEEDLTTALSLDELDVALICSDNAGHRPLLEAAVRRGLDVFCEKPMALTVEDADCMLEAIRETGVRAVFGYFQPFSGAARAVRKLLERGDLGEITQIRYRNAHSAAYGHAFDDPTHRWFTEPEKAGGGAFLDMGTHAVHFVRSFFGPVSSVTALIGNKSGVYPDVDDFGIALLEFANGITGVVEASWVFPTGPRGLEVIGSRGRIEWDGEVRWTPVDGDVGETRVVAEEEPEPTRLQRLIALRNGEIDPASAEADLQCCRDAVAVMCAAYESAATGRHVTL